MTIFIKIIIRNGSFEHSDHEDDRDAEEERGIMDEISLHIFRMLYFRNEVGGGDIDEVARGEGQEEADVVVLGKEVCDEPPQDHGEAGEEIEHERFLLLPAAVDQNAEVAEFLRDLMGGACDPGDDTDAEIHQERSGDSETVDEIMQPVRNQNEISHRLLVLAGRLVAVVPMDGLFQEKE